MYAVPVGLGALVVCLMVDYRTLTHRSLLPFGALVLALVYVHFGGHMSGGSRRWIPIGPVSLQPSEFARMAVALVLAMFFGDGRRSAKSLVDLALGGVFVLVPFLLIFKAAGPRDGRDARSGVRGRRVTWPACGCGGSWRARSWWSCSRR